jgi:hypothetical protein
MAEERKGRETGPRHNVRELVVDPETIFPYMSDEKIRTLLVELEMIMEEYDRSVAIMYLSGNYSGNKHLSTVVLQGMYDTEIVQIMSETRDSLKKEIKNRKERPKENLPDDPFH